MESLVTYNIFLTLSYVTLQVFELHVSDCAQILHFSLDGRSNLQINIWD